MCVYVASASAGEAEWPARGPHPRGVCCAAMNVLVTGGSGFIGSNLVRYILKRRPDWKVVNLDKLTYAGNPESLSDIERDPRYHFVQGDIGNHELVAHILGGHRIDLVIHSAAETHVDRS